MFDYISGKLVTKRPTEAILDVQGVGYLLKISLSTAQQLPEEGSPASLKTYLHVREDILQLYGFADEEEREIFEALLSISGIGPKLAQTILSGLSPDKLISAIQLGDERTLSSITGVGKKTAQRLIVELKDKLKSTQIGEIEHAGAAGGAIRGTLEEEALMALMSLGYSRQQAEKAITRARNSGKIVSAEELIKKALQAV